MPKGCPTLTDNISDSALFLCAISKTGETTLIALNHGKMPFSTTETDPSCLAFLNFIILFNLCNSDGLHQIGFFLESAISVVFFFFKSKRVCLTLDQIWLLNKIQELWASHVHPVLSICRLKPEWSVMLYGIQYCRPPYYLISEQRKNNPLCVILCVWV